MSKVKEREKEQTIKRPDARGGGRHPRKQAMGEPVVGSPKKGELSVVAIQEYKPTSIGHSNQYVGIRFDQRGFEAEKETIAQVDKYSRFIDHILDLRKDEVDLADWSIARAANRRKK